MTCAVVQDELFLIGGTLTKKALVVSLPEIVHSDFSSTTNTSAQWRTFPAPPLEDSAAITFHGSLLAVGGKNDSKNSKDIYIYHPSSNNWSKVGELPTARSGCSCTMLPSGEILVTGGLDDNGKISSRVDVAKVATFP